MSGWWPHRVRSGDAGGGVPAQARAAFRAGLADGTTDLTRVADLFLGWALSAGEAGDLAEGYWMQSVATARAAEHRALPASQLAVLADAQHIATEAGYWLAATGRSADAVEAVEHSRAVLLSRLAAGVAPDIRAALVTAGRTDLLDNYLGAQRRRADAYRGQYSGRRSTVPAISRGSRSYQAGVASELELAQAELAQRARQIADVAGPVDGLDLPSYRDIRAVAWQAPLVYLGAAEAGGYALIVRDHGEPELVWLPGLSAGELAPHLSTFTTAPPVPRGVRACVDWLSAVLRNYLSASLARDTEISLVPLGPLNLLPVNAALIEATLSRPAGPLVVRLLPSARVMAGAHAPAAARPPASVLVVDATHTPGGAPLPRSRREGEILAGRYGTQPLCYATSATVLPALASADLVHFLGHGRADLTDPLASGLRLMDGWLTLRALLRRPPLRPQLVVLSACESHFGGMSAPDEVLSLPAALVQAGVAGVIAAQWRVGEQVALVTLRRFYDHLDRGAPPAQALTHTQAWLRSATRSDLVAAYPDLFTACRGTSRTARAAEQPAYGAPSDWAAFTYTGISGRPRDELCPAAR